jgi:ATP-dependent helicase/DNAse subunit B
MGGMALTLLTGPANAGKVQLLLDRYLAALDRDPVLIVPNRPDVERVERDLLRRTGALVGGEIGTFADLFERLAVGDDSRPVATDLQRALIVRRVVERAALNGWSSSARFGGFADSLAATIGELESGLVHPDTLGGALAPLYRDYRAELDRLGLHDRQLRERRASDRIASELRAWDDRPVFAYGFEDLTGTEWALLQGLAGRTEVTVSLPYEPGRAAFGSLERTASDLAALAGPGIEELPPAYGEVAPPAFAHLERALFAEGTAAQPPPLEGAIRFLEGAGTRATLELVAEELLALLREGVDAEKIAVICPSVDRLRAPLETALETMRVPYAVEARVRLNSTPFGRALLSLLHFEWRRGGRHELYAFLRSPYSGLARGHVDYLEGRLRGRAVQARERVEEETIRLRDGRSLPPLELLRNAPDPLAATASVARAMLQSAYGLEAPPVGASSRLDLRAHETVARVLEDLQGWKRLGNEVSVDELLLALERASVRLAGATEAGRIAVLDLMRGRTRRYDVVFVLGLEEGSLPRRAEASPFLDDDERRELDERHRDVRLARPDRVERDRYLFYTACTRASRRLYLVREAATDDGSPREPSPFWDEARAVFDPDEVRRATRRRPLSLLTWPLERAPTERERMRAVAALAADDRPTAEALARANGWERRLDRALAALERRTRLTHPAVLEELRARTTFGVTELEAFADCSSIWLLERIVDPKTIDSEVDAKLRGSIVHTALHKFFVGLPKELGLESVEPDRLDDAIDLARRCLDEALAGIRMELTDLERSELDQSLWRDLEQFVRDEAESVSPLVPRRFEVSFGSERSAPELQAGLGLGGFTLAGKIDRIDVDPFSARAIVQDYKSGKTAHSAAKIESELRLQIPLYMLVLRDLIGMEPLGGVYRALGGRREARGLLRAEARDEGLPGFQRNDYLDEETFWGQVDRAQELARGFVDRIRSGDVKHDPRTGDCPPWCELWTMCRVRRA